MRPNSRLQAGEITDFIMPAWCSSVKAVAPGTLILGGSVESFALTDLHWLLVKKPQREGGYVLLCAGLRGLCPPLCLRKGPQQGLVTPDS